MPATEETYRRQPTLHLVFALSSIAMLAVTVWMIMADHLRPWKDVQRRFHRVETDKLKAQEKQKLEETLQANRDALAQADAEIKQAEEIAARNAAEIRRQEARIRKTRGEFELLDTARRFQKAELDSLRSLYDGMIDLGQYERAREYIATTITPAEASLENLSLQFEEVQSRLNEELKVLEELRGNLDERRKRKESLMREVDRIARLLQQKEEQYYGLGAWIRGLPILDLAAPPTKIQQISLPELTINYNFKDVPRYDRCTTCHMGIDRLGYDVDAEGNPMPMPFSSHPHLTDLASYIDPKGQQQPAGLYLDPNGPHPINSFGCTICHGGQGSGTDFTYSSHTPNDLEEQARWEHEHHWHKMHHWDEPMLPSRFVYASCLKCHHEVTDIPEAVAPKLRAGYERITKYGCTGCHTIGGEGAVGPDLTDNRQVGSNLAHIASKNAREWTLAWIRNPHAFRPDSRMPRFYGLSNNSAPADQGKVNAEVHAITHYLYARSTPPKGFQSQVPAGDAERGKELFFAKGCMACHTNRPYEASDYPPELRDQFRPGTDPALTFAPQNLPKAAQPYADDPYGPNLINLAAKFRSTEAGHNWLTNWIHAPNLYHSKSLMPNLQLSLEEAADISAWLLSLGGNWQVPVEVPPVEDPAVQQGLDELVNLFLTKSKTYKGKELLLSEVDDTVKSMSTDEKLMYVGERTISRLGCFGCHNIPGFENAKPIGTPLNDWGFKSPAKLDFAHIAEYLDDNVRVGDEGKKDYDGTDEYYYEELLHHSRNGFLYQKLHRPRSYDYKKTNEELKTWDDRLRMPQFSWADDPQAIEEVMTFVLGLTGEKVNAKYLPRYADPAKYAKARGERLLVRYNCRGCHTLAMPKFAVPLDVPDTAALPDLQANLDSSYSNRSTDHPGFYPDAPYDPKITSVRLKEQVTPDEQVDPETTLVLAPEKPEAPIVIEGMPIGESEEELDGGVIQKKIFVQLWQPVTIRGYKFNVGDNITVDAAKVEQTPPDGGDFAWLYAYTESERTGSNFAAIWNRLPPPLIREGRKVQTPWMTSFLKDPYPIRPATNLRMPRFHYGSEPEPDGEAIAGVPPTPTPITAATRSLRADVDAETRDLANYFAAIDGAEFPYQDIPQRDRAYLSEQEQAHQDYLAGGWRIVTQGACVQCHAIGVFKPTGGQDVVNGPDLRQVNDRFRPDYLFEWLAQPSRLVPYTAMPQNIPPRPAPGPTPAYVPPSFEGHQLDQVRAMRDMLLNYTRTVEQQLATGTPTPPTAPAATPPPRAPGASE